MIKVNAKLFMMCDCVDSTSLMEVTEEELEDMEYLKNSDGDYVIGGMSQNLGLVGKHGKIKTFYDGNVN